MSKKVLFVANRGEIARRIIRSANDLGFYTVVAAIKGRDEERAYYTKEAAEVAYYDGFLAKETFLSTLETVKLALRFKVTHLHPGYGFLSENADFALAVTQAGIKFVGPSSSTLENLGSKTKAKDLASLVGVPIVPGIRLSENVDLATKETQQFKETYGLPLIIKAGNGGGGRGMRIVDSQSNIQELIESASLEAKRAFGSPLLFLEKFLVNARHIEVQGFGDREGNFIHLFERDCSIQRRFQKVIEIAPAANLNSDIRLSMFEASKKIAEVSKLENACTFEYLVAEDKFYFIEANPRLQVEHTITEEITAIDIVALQLKIALGEKLPSQAQIKENGFSIQARVCAEVPENDFKSSSGEISVYQFPSVRGIRVDTGYIEGESISPSFDSLIQKSISRGASFLEARDILISHLELLDIGGIGTNVAFLLNVLNEISDPACLHTKWLEIEHMGQGFASEEKYEKIIVKSEAMFEKGMEELRPIYLPLPEYRISCPNFEHLRVLKDHKVSRSRASEISEIKLCRVIRSELSNETERLIVNINGYCIFLSRTSIKELDTDTESLSSNEVRSPLPGVVLSVLVKLGDLVTKGQVLVKIDSMKTEHSIVAQNAGEVKKIYCSSGQNVSKSYLLVEIG